MFPSDHNIPTSAMLGSPNNPLQGGTPMSPMTPASSGPPTLNLTLPSQPAQQPFAPAPQQQPQAPSFQAPNYAAQPGGFSGFAPTTSGQPMPPAQPQVPQPQAPMPPLGGPSAANFNPYMQAPAAPQAPQPYAQPQQFAPQYPQQPQPQYPAQLPAQPQVPQYGAPYLPQQPAPTTALRDSMARDGYSVSQYASDRELLADISQIVANGQNAQQQLALLQAQASQQATQQQPAGGAPAQPGATGAPQQPQTPEWDPAWNSLVRLDPSTGTYVPANQYISPLAAAKANEYQAFRRQRADQLVTDPMQVIGPQLEQRLTKMRDDLKKEVRTEFVKEQREAQTDALITDFFNKNKTTFTQMGPDGRTPAIGLDGKEVLSPMGQAFAHYASAYKQQFVATYGQEPDRLDILRHTAEKLQADQAAGRFGPQQQQVPPGYPQQQLPAQPQQPFVPQAPHLQMFGPPAQPFGVAPQLPYGAAPMQPAMPPLGGPSMAGSYMQPQYAPQFPQPGFAPQQPGYPDPQQTMVARAMANQAMYAPQPNGTIVNNMMNPQVPQQPSTDLKSLFQQAAQARGMSIDGFTQ